MSIRNWEFESTKLWPLLVKAAKDRQTIVYEDLAKVVNTNPLSMRYALGPIFWFCYEEHHAPLTSIVVGKSNGKPGDGFIKWWGENYKNAIAETFDYDWSNVSNPFLGYSVENTTDSFSLSILSSPTSSGEIYRKVQARGQLQKIFRAALLIAYNNSCSICGCTYTSVLEAAHIVPWTKCGPDERIDPRNGILLCANHHKLFDSGILTVSTDYKVVHYDPKMEDGAYSETDELLSASAHGSKIGLPKDKNIWPLKKYIGEHHNIHEWAL